MDSLEDFVYIDSREDLFYMAKLAVQAERYDERLRRTQDLLAQWEGFHHCARPVLHVFGQVVEAMNSVAKLDEALIVEERKLFTVGYKTLIDAKRELMRILGSIEMKEETKGKERHARMAVEYRHKVEAELDKLCYDVIDIIDKYLIPHSSGAESSVFYYKMKGDYYRYFAEFKIGTKRSEVSDLSLKAYETASKIAETDLSPTDPLRLSLALNISVFYYEIMNSPDKACRVAKHTFDETVSEPHLVNDEKYNNSELIMRALKDNLKLWNSDMADNADDIREGSGNTGAQGPSPT